MDEKIRRTEKLNMDLLYAISNGSKSDMDAWGGTQLHDFFVGLESHQDAIKLMESRIEAARQKQK